MRAFQPFFYVFSLALAALLPGCSDNNSMSVSGELLWEYLLPAPAFATPALYEVDGVQYIALACGGEKLGTPKGNKIIAFTLKL